MNKIPNNHWKNRFINGRFSSHKNCALLHGKDGINGIKKKISFVEIMIALMVLSAGILPLFVIFSSSHRQTVVARNSLQAIYLGRTIIDRARFTPFFRLRTQNNNVFKPVEGYMISTQLLNKNTDKSKIKWPDFYKRYTYNLKKIPIKDTQSKEIIAYKLLLTLKWVEKKQKKELHFAGLVARMER
ncbi:hypothetical protein ACFL35_09555 [Candidatus Riflebacteria bacterium]